MSTALQLAPTRTPRQILREWMQAITGESDEYDVGQLTERAVRRFADDPEMKAACLAYAVRDLMPQVAGQEFRRLRDASRHDFDDKVAEKLARWYEHVGNGVHKSLLAMNKPELVFSVAEREATIAGHQRVVDLERDFLSGLKGDKQTVRQRYRDEEIAAVWRRHYDDPRHVQPSPVTSALIGP